MLDANLKSQLEAYLKNIVHPVELVASLGAGPKSQELKTLLEEIVSVSHGKVEMGRDYDDERQPSFLIRRKGTDIGVRFAGIPLGHEFTSLVLALLHVGGHPSKAAQEVIQQVKDLEGDYVFETYFSLSCQNCPDVVQALNLMSVLNPRIKHVAIEGGLFKDEVEERKIMAVPTVFLNGELFGQGRMELEQIVARLDSGAEARAAERLKSKDPFDVLVVGGGPAGAAAAIYTARKGIRTGIVAERFGGQVLDTMAIENFISVPHTEGPKLAAHLEQHVREYEVDIMNLQKAARLVPAEVPGGLHEVVLENGASLKSRTVILATGARWRQMNVPGEDQYKNKGVAYCPHCDGPLFKGKRVAVIGGGNSTTQVQGDGEKVTGLSYKDRNSDAHHDVDLEGVFVQIGLVPNTEWLRGAVALTARGEIEVDHRGETSQPGIFGAGDVTTVPYKQIVIAMGEGSKAGLSAFDYMIRTIPAEEAVEAA